MYRNLNLEDLQGEIWKDVDGYVGLYKVSNFGRIKSICLNRFDKNGKKYNKKPIIMKQSFTSTGYLMVNLKKKFFKVHRLVAIAFLENTENKKHINHKDCNPLNNNVENLEWVTPKENVIHALENYRRKNVAYFTVEEKENICNLYKSGKTMKDLAKQFNCKKTSICRILRVNNIKKEKYVNYKTKYNINVKQLKEMFDKGIPNKEIIKHFNCSKDIITTRKYQYKKGEF